MRRGIVSCAALLGSCSVVVGEHDFATSNCREHVDCEVLNDADGIGPEECVRWQCGEGALGQSDGAARRCRMQPRDDDGDGYPSALHCQTGTDCDDADPRLYAGAVERCDGLDNDCDATIDEAQDGRAVIEPPASSSLALDHEPEHVSYAVDDEAGAVALWVARDGYLPFARVASLDPLRSLRERFALRVPSEDAAAEPRIGRCSAWSPQIEGVIELPCEPREIALGFAGGSLLSAAVAQLGDGDGQLRVGHALGLRDPGLSMPGPAVRSNSYLGIDIDGEGEGATGRTSGSSRMDGARGAARPALATLERKGAFQMLAAWLGTRPGSAECIPDDESPVVESLVGFLEGDDEGERWLSTTSQHREVVTPPRVEPARLGSSGDGVGPAVLAWPGEGYFVAYGDVEGRLALHFMPAPAPPEPLDSCLARNECGDPEVQRPAPVLRVELSRAFDLHGAAVRGVALAGVLRDDGRDERFELGIAVREGCEPGAQRIVFVRAHAMRNAGVLELEPFDPVALVAAEGSYGPPAIAYTASGISREPSTERGGFVVAFADRGARRLLAGRVAERGGELLDVDAPIVLGWDLGSSPALDERPFLYTDRSAAVSFAYADAARGLIRFGRLSCDASPQGDRR